METLGAGSWLKSLLPVAASSVTISEAGIWGAGGQTGVEGFRSVSAPHSSCSVEGGVGCPKAAGLVIVVLGA